MLIELATCAENHVHPENGAPHVRTDMQHHPHTSTHVLTTHGLRDEVPHEATRDGVHTRRRFIQEARTSDKSVYEEHKGKMEENKELGKWKIVAQLQSTRGERRIQQEETGVTRERQALTQWKESR